MADTTPKKRTPLLRIAVWVLFVAAFVVLYSRESEIWGAEAGGLPLSSAFLAAGLYLVLGALRGFALIPVTNLILIAIPVFPPMELFTLTVIGVVISSACIYAFAGSLGLSEYFDRKHAEKTARVRAALQRNPTMIVATWSFLPIAPTDLICYVCGAMRISFTRFLVGLLIGEGTICALYIFGGHSLLELGKRFLAA
jgi:uncharacterized membrane protein YdjX (TVP38/TMEM64 family)